jgi:hypothetical protein
MGPCTVNVFFKYNQQDATLYNITVNAVHISGDFSAPHQELKKCTHSIGYMSSLLAATSSGIYVGYTLKKLIFLLSLENLP